MVATYEEFMRDVFKIPQPGKKFFQIRKTTIGGDIAGMDEHGRINRLNLVREMRVLAMRVTNAKYFHKGITN
ncbi:hypothetical protein GCM10023189_32770 [Nibrella saemangeumensis]|uniref:Uncharacterized protein n=1 Tax=Nibrella saemangeumensis TaxID=1084526 RepID=A0ABP8N3L3_9BACT